MSCFDESSFIFDPSNVSFSGIDEHGMIVVTGQSSCHDEYSYPESDDNSNETKSVASRIQKKNLSNAQVVILIRFISLFCNHFSFRLNHS